MKRYLLWHAQNKIEESFQYFRNSSLMEQKNIFVAFDVLVAI